MTNIQQKRDTPANWAAINPILRLGQVGWEMTPGQPSRGKVGDGATHWNDLPYSVQATVDLSAYAKLDTPVFTGNPTAPTRGPLDDTDSIATTAHVKDVLAASPALGGDPTAPTPSLLDNDTSIATTAFVKGVLLNSPLLGGDARATTPAPTDNDSSIATTAFVKNVLAGSPLLGGDPRAPTPALGDNDTSIATTAFVQRIMGMVTQGIQFGSIGVPLSSANSGQVAITFPTPYTGAGTPFVFAMAYGTVTYIGGSNTATNTGVNISAAHKDAATNSTVTVTVLWFAVK